MLETATGQSSKSEKEESRTKKVDFSPKGIFLEFPFLLDLSIKNFIDDFQSSFVQRKKDGVFALSKSFSKRALGTLFSDYLSKNIDRIVSTICRAHSEWQNVFVIVSDSGHERRTAFKMREKDVDIGLEKIAAVAESIFNKHFVHQSAFGQHGKKTIWCRHNFLLARDWEGICAKKVLGKKNFASCFPTEKELLCIEEVVDDSAIANTTSSEQKLIVEEASSWLLSNLSA